MLLRDHVEDARSSRYLNWWPLLVIAALVLALVGEETGAFPAELPMFLLIGGLAAAVFAMGWKLFQPPDPQPRGLRLTPTLHARNAHRKTHALALVFAGLAVVAPILNGALDGPRLVGSTVGSTCMVVALGLFVFVTVKKGQAAFNAMPPHERQRAVDHLFALAEAPEGWRAAMEQDGAADAGPLAHAFERADDLASWRHQVEIASAHRASLLAQQSSRAPAYAFFRLLELGTLLSPLVLLFPREHLATSAILVVLAFATMAHGVARRVLAARALADVARGIDHAMCHSGQRASKAELEWLNRAGWGFTVFVQGTEGLLGRRHVVTGFIGESDVMVSVAHRWGTPRRGAAGMADDDDAPHDDSPPSRSLTSIYIACPTAGSAPLPPHVHTAVARLGFIAHPSPSGLRLSKNDASAETGRRAIALAQLTQAKAPTSTG